jgi:hypothetical protein
MSPSHPTNTYTTPFDPICNGPGEYATTQEKFNCQRFEKKRGSRVTPYLSFNGVYRRSTRCAIGRGTFKDLYLVDLVEANKMWERVQALFDITLTLLL